MDVKALAVEGALAFPTQGFPDDRGVFVSPFQATDFEAATGHPLFPVAQISYSSSRRGVLRGLHYTATPPGCAKYVHCSRGRILDIVLDTRVGSPTFARWDSIVLHPDGPAGIYFPVGVAHMFVALEDDTVVTYLLSQEYVAGNELAVFALDPALGLPLPADLELLMSDRDRAAPTLAQARAAGTLPEYRRSTELDAAF
jgi:epimerase EvaD